MYLFMQRSLLGVCCRLTFSIQLVLNVHLRYCDSAPMMQIVTISEHPSTGQLLMLMHFADDSTLEKQPKRYIVLANDTTLSSCLAHLPDLGFSHSDLQELVC